MSKKTKKQKLKHGFPRPIDHIVLSLADLDLARQRFENLGFNLSPIARHNFGTENTIIPFVNGTFLEPLGIGDADQVNKHRVKGNPFLVRDHAYRFRHGDENFSGGFSMAVLSGNNAKTDRKLFRKNGLRTGKMAVVKRPGLNIRACFALDDRSPDCTVFACERVSGAPVFDKKTCNHPNGALRLASIVLTDENPTDFGDYLKLVCGQKTFVETEFGIELKLANGDFYVYTPEGMRSKFGIKLPETKCREGLRLVSYDIGVRSLDDTAMLLAQRGIEARQVDNRIVVANSPGQGAMFAFVEDDKN